MAEIQKLQALVANLRSRAAKATKDNNVSVVVGYTQAYALYVHENLEARHGGAELYSSRRKKWYTGVGNAKFLEGPARRLTGDGSLGEIVATAKRKGQTMAQALVLAGLRLQRESQQEVPVDTGALKNSAFTRLDT